MGERKLMIINDNSRMTYELEKCFKSRDNYEIVFKAANSEEAINYLEEGHSPDVILIDMLMPYCDGNQLLYILKKKGLCKNTTFIGISPLYTDEAMTLAQAAGFAFVIALPCSANIIAMRVDQLMDIKMGKKSNQLLEPMGIDFLQYTDCEDIVRQYLVHMGMATQHSGFMYAMAAIKMYVDNDGTKNLGITKTVYPEVAKMYNTNARVVERSIRYAISYAWLNGDMELQHNMFGYTVDGNKGCPTNKEFLTMIAEHTRLRLKTNLNRYKN